MHAFTDTQDHLLTLIPEKQSVNLRTDSQMPVDLSGPGNNSLPYLTKAQAPGRGSGSPKKGRPRRLHRTPMRAESKVSDSEFIWGQAWVPPSSVPTEPTTTSQPLTAEKLDQMTVVRPRREILGGIALGMAVAATALGVFNRVQINQLKTELFEVKENVGRLFEVVQDFSNNFASLETGFNEIRTTFLYQVMFNPTLFDSRLSRLENQLRTRLHRVTHAIQAAMHQRFAIDYLNPAELVQLFEQLAARADEAGCELLIQYHSDLFQVETSLLFDGQDGHILIHVPMAPKGTLLRLFRLHPFPLPMFETHHLMIDAEDDILAISSTELRYNVQLSSTDLLSCHRMNQVFMCDAFGVMSRRFNDTCLGALYMQRFELIRGLCKFKVIPLKEQVYQVRKGQYLVYSPEASTANMRCRNGTHSELHLQRGTQQIRIPPGCQGFFLDHVATSDYSVRLASEVMHFTWDWDPLTLLPAADIEEMGKVLRNMSHLHLVHPDLLELQYITRQNNATSELERLGLGLQGFASSAGAYFTSFGSGMGVTIVLIIIALSYLNCRRGGKCTANLRSDCGSSSGTGPGTNASGDQPYGIFGTIQSLRSTSSGYYPTGTTIAATSPPTNPELLRRWRLGRGLQRQVPLGARRIGDVAGSIQL
jgi:hypothetical protein